MAKSDLFYKLQKTVRANKGQVDRYTHLAHMFEKGVPYAAIEPIVRDHNQASAYRVQHALDQAELGAPPEGNIVVSDKLTAWVKPIEGQVKLETPRVPKVRPVRGAASAALPGREGRPAPRPASCASGPRHARVRSSPPRDRTGVVRELEHAGPFDRGRRSRPSSLAHAGVSEGVEGLTLPRARQGWGDDGRGL